MGMDISGLKPKTKKGEYFQNNVWYWRLLWNYCEEIAPDIIPADNLGHSNDGWGLPAKKAKELGERLLELIESGHTESTAKEYQQHKNSIPKETCFLCNGSGCRRDAIGVVNGMDKKEWCNGCDGKGKRAPTITWYSFDIENVREFAEFLIASGGFKIY